MRFSFPLLFSNSFNQGSFCAAEAVVSTSCSLTCCSCSSLMDINVFRARLGLPPVKASTPAEIGSHLNAVAEHNVDRRHTPVVQETLELTACQQCKQCVQFVALQPPNEGARKQKQTKPECNSSCAKCGCSLLSHIADSDSVDLEDPLEDYASEYGNTEAW